MSGVSKARRRWSKEEDDKLRRLVAAAESDENQIVWRDVATEMVTRNANQCRERWSNHLQPGLRRGEFSTAEDEVIVRLQKEIGNQWSAIAAKLNRRTDIDVKNRWHKLHRLSKRKPDSMTATDPRVGMKVLVKFAEDGYNKLYDGTITAVENDSEQQCGFLLQIQYEDGSFEDDCFYPDDDIYLIDCQSSNDGLTEEEVSLSSELLNIYNSLLANDENKTKKLKVESKCEDGKDEEVISAKENQDFNLKFHH